MMRKSSSAPRSRGRPREFDTARALARASELFRRRGLASTSLDQLAASMGISKPSLYAAYGDKLDLYLCALEAFAERMGRAAESALAEGSCLEEALSLFYAAVLDIYFEGRGGPKGCLIMATASAEALSEPRVKRLLARALSHADAAVADRIRLASSSSGSAGRVEALEAAALARIVTGVMTSLGTRARAGESRAALDEVAATTARLVASSVC